MQMPSLLKQHNKNSDCSVFACQAFSSCVSGQNKVQNAAGQTSGYVGIANEQFSQPQTMQNEPNNHI